MLLGSPSQGNWKSGQRPRRSAACEHCRIKHLRCDGLNVCRNCLHYGTICTYPRRARRLKDPSLASAQLQNNSAEAYSKQLEYARYTRNGASIAQRFDAVEGLCCDEVAPSIIAASVSNVTVPVDLSTLEASGILLEGTQASSEAVTDRSRSRTSLTLDDGGAATSFHNSVITLPASLCTKSFKDCQVVNPLYPVAVEDTVHDDAAHREQRQTQMQSPSASPESGSSEADCVYRQNLADWEYHGPRSFMSICSKPGIGWVSERTGASLYGKFAENLVADVTKLLKISNSTRERAGEPDEETARKWCRAYFEEAYGTWFGIVDPQEFDEQIGAHFKKISSGRGALSPASSLLRDDSSPCHPPQRPSYPSDTESPAWYVLRNAVFAAGSRVVLAKTTNYKTTHEISCGYLENCMATLTDLLYTQTGLMAIQALAVMMCFVQGLGCPSLDYMLCSAAARLSQSKGLHRKVPKFSGLTESQVSHQSWIFWAIYCCEKQASMRSDRPSAFDDEDINCEVPQMPPPGRNGNIKFCTTAINYARLFSAASKKLSISRILRGSPDAVINTVNELHAEAQNLLESTPAEYVPASVLGLARHNEQPFDVLHTQMNYWGLLCHIHSVFLYPWVNDAIESMSAGSAVGSMRTWREAERDRRLRLRDQVTASSMILAEASRNIILATEHIRPDATSCKDSALFFPFLAVINIFLHILKLPSLNTVRSDISLLEVCAGHFRWVEFATDSRCIFPFMKELPNWARMAVMNITIARELRPGAPQYAANAKKQDKGIEGKPENEMVAESNVMSSVAGYTADHSTVGGSNGHQSLQSRIIPSPTMETDKQVSLSFESRDSPHNQLEGIEMMDLDRFSEEDLELFWQQCLQDHNYSQN